MNTDLNAEIYISTSNDPRFNLALEDLLFEHTERTGSVILYLWQNENTVVIGKSQNAWREVRTEQCDDAHSPGFRVREKFGIMSPADERHRPCGHLRGKEPRKERRR